MNYQKYATRLGLAALLTALPAAPVSATGLRVETRAVQRPAGASALRVQAVITWKNAWRNARNHDAVWLIVKLRSRTRAEWQHARLLQVAGTGSSPAAACSVSADHVGAFCAPADTYRGDIAWQVTLDVAPGSLPEADLAAGAVEARVIGMEMVYIPAGPFTMGDADPASVQGDAFYRSDAQGNYAGTYRVTSEAPIRIAPAAGALFYQTRYPQYGGDRMGPVPAEFPKGTNAFYVMKYEILQGQYAMFLNTIPFEATYFRTPMSGRDYYNQRGTIRFANDVYAADKPDRPANWVSWDDGAAFADWAGLRPWTELEFTKAARGPDEPVAGDYPWGTAARDRLLRRMGPDDDLVQSGEADESRLTDATRDMLGASHYWVMDLGGSVWEKVVTIGHPKGRAFRGTHGDGVIRNYGQATNDDWPAGDFDGGGYGYRGGGYYARGMRDDPTNPYSPVARRPYGSWGGAPRSIAYGFRAARSADADGASARPR